jgi:single-stranded-DNA-specific exonuclease
MDKSSILGNKWEILEYDVSKAMFFGQSLGLSPALSSILASNPLITMEELRSFLSPSIKNLMPNPFESLLDVELAVVRIVKAIMQKEKIVIFGDYDVDGGTSCAIFKRFFNSIGVNCDIYIPDRVKEGYGPNSNALLELRKNGADLVITVDCGTVAFEPLLKANEAGLEIIVIDHHLGVKEKPQSIAIINPNRFDETSQLTYLCGAGVTFMLIVALNMTLRKNNFYREVKEPNLLSLLDLVALGTVCDVMPLVGLNRAFVKTGLEVVKAKTNLGLKTLLAIAGSEAEITEFTLGFIIGPRINAGGRIGKSTLGATLLSTQNEEEAIKIANELHDLNSKRKDMEEASLEIAIKKIESLSLESHPVIFVQDEAFHQGIIGILASRIKDRYNKPVAVFSCLDGYLKASLRSVEGLDLGSIIHKAHKKDLLIAGGGHASAGGLSVSKQKYDSLFNFFLEEVESADFDFQKTIYASTQITLNAVSPELCLEVKKLAPFGNANPKPIFHFKSLIVVRCDVLKEAHVSLILKDQNSGKTAKAMFFKAHQMGVLHKLAGLYGKEVDVMAEVELNEWNGQKSAVLHLVDVAV